MSKFRKSLYCVRRRSRGNGGNYTSGNVYSSGIRMDRMLEGVNGSVKFERAHIQSVFNSPCPQHPSLCIRKSQVGERN